jgi:GNAT superfamily N-acetyltransferase
MEFSIRPVREDDLEALEELAVLAWEPVFVSLRTVLGPAIDDILYPDWQQQQRRTVRRYCAEMPEATALVAEVEGTVAGFIVYELNQAEFQGEVELLAVHPAYQNQGVGTELNRVVIEHMREAGMRLVMVETGGDPGHAPARRTYEKAGYTLLPIARYFQAL